MADDTKDRKDHDESSSGFPRRDFVMSVAAGLAAAGAASGAAKIVETEVEIKTPDGTCDAAFIHPASGSHAGVLIWPDAFGLRPSMREMAKRLAAEGYSVLVPNPFYRMGKAPFWTDASTVDFAKDLSLIHIFFDGQLFQEKDPPPRFYVKLGTGYLAFGGNPNVPPSIDHFCVLLENYQPQEMRKSLEAAGVPLGAGPFGMATDPDGMRLQFLRVPGGLAKTIIPAYRLSAEDALFEAVAPDHVMLHLSLIHI